MSVYDAFHVEQLTIAAPLKNHNLVTYKAPLEIVPDSIAELLKDPAEAALADNAVWFFLDNPSWEEKDRARMRKVYARRGLNMFNWKHYRIARCYLGGYKALSACLVLRSL